MPGWDKVTLQCSRTTEETEWPQCSIPPGLAPTVPDLSLDVTAEGSAASFPGAQSR